MAATKANSGATSKKTVVKKKAPAKKHTVVTQVATPTAAEQSFFEFRVTQQTLYWLVLGLVSIIFALWIVTLDSRIQKLYDEIDASTYSNDVSIPKKTEAN